MQEKNMLLSIIVNKDLMKLLDESNAKELPDSAETQEKDALNESAGFLKNCSSSSQQSMEEICSNIPDIIHDASSPDDDDDDDFHLASSFLPIKQPNTSKLFGGSCWLLNLGLYGSVSSKLFFCPQQSIGNILLFCLH